jgi:hypothetical protein
MLIYLLFLASFLYLRVLKPCKYAGCWGKIQKNNQNHSALCWWILLMISTNLFWFQKKLIEIISRKIFHHFTLNEAIRAIRFGRWYDFFFLNICVIWATRLWEKAWIMNPYMQHFCGRGFLWKRLFKEFENGDTLKQLLARTDM